MTDTDSYTYLVKEAIFCFEQSTPEKYEEDLHKAARYETCIYELFALMNDNELNCYRAKLIELGYATYPDYARTENGLVTTKNNKWK